MCTTLIQSMANVYVSDWAGDYSRHTLYIIDIEIGLYMLYILYQSTQQTQDVQSMLVYRWSTVYDVGPGDLATTPLRRRGGGGATFSLN